MEEDMDNIVASPECEISVVTVCLNAGSDIVDTLKSVRDQSFPGLEHIIWDGGSEPDSLSKIEHNLHSRAKLHRGVDSGIYDAMNKASTLASGDFIVFLNAGDVFLDAGVIDQILRSLRETSADVLCCGVLMVDQNNISIVKRRWRVNQFKPWFLRFGWMAPHPGLVVRKDLFAALGGFTTKYKISGDYDFQLRLFNQTDSEKVKVGGLISTKMRLGGASNGSIGKEILKLKEDISIYQSCYNYWFIGIFFKKVKFIKQRIGL